MAPPSMRFFIADAWVDFSYGGVLVMSVLVGFVVKWSIYSS